MSSNYHLLIKNGEEMLQLFYGWECLAIIGRKAQSVPTLRYVYDVYVDIVTGSFQNLNQLRKQNK